MKTLLSLLLIFITTFSFAKEIVVTKQGGKPCKGNKSEICYDYVYYRDTNEKLTIKCTDAGNQGCPAGNIVVVGQHIMDVDGIIANVESEIIQGSLNGNGTVLGGGTVIANYSWVGLVNEDNILEYVITINTVE